MRMENKNKQKQASKIKILPQLFFLAVLQSNKRENATSIISCNILNENLLASKRYPFIKDQKLRAWDECRLPSIRDVMSKFNAVVMCFQEIDVNPITFGECFEETEKMKHSLALGPVTPKQK